MPDKYTTRTTFDCYGGKAEYDYRKDRFYADVWQKTMKELEPDTMYVIRYEPIEQIYPIRDGIRYDLELRIHIDRPRMNDPREYRLEWVRIDTLRAMPFLFADDRLTGLTVLIAGIYGNDPMIVTGHYSPIDRRWFVTGGYQYGFIPDRFIPEYWAFLPTIDQSPYRSNRQ